MGLVRRRAHHYGETRARDGVQTCVHCGTERRSLITLMWCEPLWSTAIVELYRPVGVKFWTTAAQRCLVRVAGTETNP